MKDYRVIGIMSGTSLDGVDIAYCRFHVSVKNQWNYEIIEATTYPYSREWQDRLEGLFNSTALQYARTHSEYGRYLGELVNQFIKEYHPGPIDFISSHGHTIFHQPSAGFTSQIGDGAAISAVCGIPVVCDFRTGDVAYGGQGAPLVPIGDQHLFREYRFCLNLGGIANISFEESNKRIAFDICYCNILLNYYSRKSGKPYDKNGEMASSGKLNIRLLEELNALDFFQKPFPKSLGREEAENIFIPVVEKHNCSVNDALRTLAEHSAFQIAAVINNYSASSSDSVLCSGGGAFNSFLTERLRNLCKANVMIAEESLLHYKEALIFAFLGVLRIRQEPNCMKSVTGASKDVSGGAIYIP